MGLFKKLIAKWNEKFFYVVDYDMLRLYLKHSEEFAVENNLALAEELNLYYENQKYHILVCNLAASDDEAERHKGIMYYVDDIEISNFDEWIMQKLGGLKGYFKIELINGDSVELNEYMQNHSELRAEDYWG